MPMEMHTYFFELTLENHSAPSSSTQSVSYCLPFLTIFCGVQNETEEFIYLWREGQK